MNAKKINRALSPDEIREITEECIARDNKSSTPASEWRAVAQGDGWTLCKIDTLPDMFALLNNVACDPLLLYRDDIPDQLGKRESIAAGYGPTVVTDGGEYELIAEVNDEGQCDDNINLYVGRATSDGHCDLIASDNASMWIVGDADDAERNREHWDTIEAHDLDMDAVRAVDADLADWLEARRDEAEEYDA